MLNLFYVSILAKQFDNFADVSFKMQFLAIEQLWIWFRGDLSPFHPAH